MPYKNCLRCNKVVRIKPSKINGMKYCSKECRYASNWDDESIVELYSFSQEDCERLSFILKNVSSAKFDIFKSNEHFRLRKLIAKICHGPDNQNNYAILLSYVC